MLCGIATVLLIGLLVSACVPTPAACGEPGRLVEHPRGLIVPGVRLGPLLVSTGVWNGETVARLGWSRAEDLPKFLVARVEPFERTLTLTGSHCETGRGLRFAEAQPWLADASLSADEIERRTNASRTIDAPMPSNPQAIDQVMYGGYIIFTDPGRWRLEAREGSRVVHSVVIELVRHSR